MNKVFISYTHCSPTHFDNVATLVAVLREKNIEVVVDSDKLPGGPDEGWPHWSERVKSLKELKKM